MDNTLLWRSEDFKIFTGVHIPDEVLFNSISKFYSMQGYRIEIDKDFERIKARREDNHIAIAITNSTPNDLQKTIMVTATQV